MFERLRQALFATPAPPAPAAPAERPEWQRRGNAALARGDLREAAAIYAEGTRSHPDDAVAWLNLGFAQLELGMAGEARASLARAEALAPPGPLRGDVWRLQAQERVRQQDWAAAARCWEQVLREAPADRAGWCELADLQGAIGDVDAASDSLVRAVALEGDATPLWPRLADLALRRNRPDEALQWTRRALQAQPAPPPPVLAALQLLHARAAQQLGRPAEALASADASMAAVPGAAAAVVAGRAAADLGDHALALAWYERALREEPGSLEALLGSVLPLDRLHRHGEALLRVDRVIAALPGVEQPLRAKALLLAGMARGDDALALLDGPLRHRGPDEDAALEIARAVCHLQAGRLARGWAHYEARFRLPVVAGAAPIEPLRERTWRGEPLAGCSVLLYAEQGLGDTLQMLRYVPLVARQAASVVLQVQEAVLPLLRDLPAHCRAIGAREAAPETDRTCPLLSLPGVFGTTLDSIPPPFPLAAPPDLVARWRERIGADAHAGLRVGLVGSGNPEHRNDHNRSLPLALIAARAPAGVRFVSLQKDLRASDAAAAASWPAFEHHGDEIASFADTAALASLMDVVISVDTSVAHLAGSCGRPLWLLLPHAPDWRWLMDRTDSPWYPTATLYRQSRPGDWDEVLARVVRDLVALQGGPAGAAAPNPHPAIADEEARALLQEGHRLEDAGRADAALGHYERAIALSPGLAAAHVSRGIALQAMGRRDEARAAYHHVLGLEADHPFGGYNLAKLHHEEGDFATAERLLTRVVAAKPDFFEAWFLLASALDALGERQAGAHAIGRAVALRPDVPGALRLQAELLRGLGDFEAAVDAAARAAALAPDDGPIAALHGLCLLALGLAEEGIVPLQRAAALMPASFDLQAKALFVLNLVEGVTQDELWRRHVALGQLLENSVPARSPVRRPDAQRRLRVGYVSADLRAHPVAQFLLPVLERRDRQRFEVTCYSGAGAGDFVTAQLRALSDHWVDTSGVHDTALAARIEADGIDLLVDLAGYSSGVRLGAFAARPAPVQLAWVGYLQTTGLRRMDYRLTDRRCDPPDAAPARHTERLLYLPHSQWCYRPFRTVPVGTRSPCEANGFVTFGSFNNAMKITGAMAARWGRLLRELPTARLLVAGVGSALKRQVLLTRIVAEGVEPHRIEFAPRTDLEAYYRLYDRVDIALDSHPYGGGTTTFDALWMGVPVVTATGPVPAARSAASILGPLGLDDWIARDVDQLVALAVRRAGDTVVLAQLRRQLRARLQASPMMDEARYVRDFEAALLQAWQDDDPGA